MGGAIGKMGCILSWRHGSKGIHYRGPGSRGMERQRLFSLIVALVIIGAVTALIMTETVPWEIGLGIIVAIGVAYGVIERGLRLRR